MSEHDERVHGVVLVRRRRNRISLIGCMGLLGGIALLSIEQAGAVDDIVTGVVRASVPDLPPTNGARRAPARG